MLQTFAVNAPVKSLVSLSRACAHPLMHLEITPMQAGIMREMR